MYTDIQPRRASRGGSIEQKVETMARKYTHTLEERYPHHHVRWSDANQVAEMRRKKRSTSMLMAAPPLIIVCVVTLGYSIYRLCNDSPQKPGKPLQTAMSPPKLIKKKVPPPVPEVELPQFPVVEKPKAKPEPKPVTIELPTPTPEPPIEAPQPPQIPEVPSVPDPPAPPLPKLVEIPPPELQPVAIEAPKVEEASYEVPVVFTVYNELRGDSPMKRTWNILLTIALASAASPAVAQQDAVTKADIDKILKRLDLMDKQTKKSIENLTAETSKTNLAIGKINKDVGKIKIDFGVMKGNDLQRKLDIDSVKTNIGKIEKKMAKMELDLKTLRDLIPDAPFQNKDITEINARLSKIEQALTQLQSQPRKVFSKSGGTGRVLIVNHYFQDLLFIVGGQNIRVSAGSSQIIESVPAGPISYEVVSPTIGSVAQRRTNVENKGTLQISVR